jgi:RNA polymerase sigma-70 factor (ECF subfamily)
LSVAGLYERSRVIGWATVERGSLVVLTMVAGALAIPLLGRRPLRRALSGGSRPDRAFTTALQRRERTALDELYAEYAPTVLGYLVNTLGDRGAAEDVHQQVFLEVWQRAPGYDPGRGSLLTWIMTIARSRGIDELRRRLPEPRELEGTLGGLADDDPERSPEALIERWRIAHLLSRLRAEEAELLRLRFYEGLSQSEIAERTEVPLGTIKTRMVAALRRLRELLDEEEAAA